jgi:hypothetical protein
LIVELERLNNTVQRFKEQQQPDWFARACAAAIALEVVFLVWVFTAAPPP